MKKQWAVLAALVLVGSLGACSKNPVAPSPAPSNSKASAQSLPTVYSISPDGSYKLWWHWRLPEDVDEQYLTDSKGIILGTFRIPHDESHISAKWAPTVDVPFAVLMTADWTDLSGAFPNINPREVTVYKS
jgi:hypothetical protein